MRKRLPALLLGSVIALSGGWSIGAIAAPDKEPDTTLNDHPSGNDKNEEPGGSGTQGNSTSDPDGDTNGGADKPGGDGGFDDDKDGNNGCGNDDDFEDDNNGWCGKPPDVEGTQSVKTDAQVSTRQAKGLAVTRSVAVEAGAVEADTAVRVMGVSFVRDEAASTAAVSAVEDTRVLGTSVVRSAGTAGLAATGAPILLWALFGLALVGAGAVAVKTAA